uniref:Reverse transcriptase domain-containing protein n=1 Tax=Graphocephala atropunctata TaxID=36148 RepID=A0A1B6KAE5_9HEMI
MLLFSNRQLFTLAYVINSCIEAGVFPSVLKHVKVIPVYKKKGSKHSYEHYRPISIISIFYKVFEIVLNRQLVLYFEKNNLFSTCQFGYRAGHGTIDAVLSFIQRCSDGLEKGLSIAGRLYDLTKAFNTVSHSILLNKLSFYGILDLSANLLASYLRERYQSVQLDGIMSSFKLVEHGVPQGSVLGPIFFIIYINDLPSVVKDGPSHPYLFADDLALSVTGSSDQSLKIKLDHCSNAIQDWCNANSLSLNDDKTIEIMFTSNCRKSEHAVAVKFLGIMLEPTLGWESHIDSDVKSMSKGIFMLRVLNMCVSQYVLSTVYYGHIRGLSRK